MMTEVFLKMVNMSIAAGWLIVVLALFRFIFAKLPKWINVLLWGAAAFRLLCPFLPESTVSLIPSGETISPAIMTEASPAINSGVGAINRVVNPVLQQSFTAGSGDGSPLQVWIPVLTGVWLAGILVLLAYIRISYRRAQKQVETAVCLRDNIFQSEGAAYPFVLGVVRPKIYLPFNVSGQEMDYVIAHEQAHVRRRDHWWKTLGFLLLTVYWFNPLIWLGYVLLCRDLELACDEKVIRDEKLGAEKRADYSQALLNCSVRRNALTACPLAFGEAHVKRRVKAVLSYKKPKKWLISIAVILFLAIVFCFLTDPVRGDGNQWWYAEERIDKPLDAAVSAAVLDLDRAEYQQAGLLQVESHVVLGMEKKYDARTGAGGSPPRETTVYLLVMDQAYDTYGGVLKEDSGSYIPTALTFTGSTESGYRLKEYWIAEDGDDYAKSIREKFPLVAEYRALYQEQAFSEELKNQCYDKALAKLKRTGGLDVRISAAMATLLSSPAASSDPGDYIRQHKKEYQELLGYGQYTLRYCFEQFLQGGQTGLSGHIMASLCGDIMRTWNEDLTARKKFANGQDWFAAFQNEAERIAKTYEGADGQMSDDDYLEMGDDYPGSELLIRMLHQ